MGQTAGKTINKESSKKKSLKARNCSHFSLNLLVVLLYIFLELRILTEKNHPQRNLQRLKSMNMAIWMVGTSNQIFMRGLKLKQNFRKNKIVTGITPFFMKSPFFTPHSVCINIDF